MAVDIYAELGSLSARVAKLERLLAKTRVAPVSYFRPDKLTATGANAWDAVIAEKPALALINPASGPGLTPSSSYTPLVARTQKAGVPVYGYTHTQYGARPLVDVKTDIDRHITWYGCEGIFVDTVSTKSEHLAYYSAICNYAHSRGAKVVLNPGTQCLEEHASMADYVMCAESDVPAYRARVARTWEANYPGKLWHCVHSCSEADMPGVVALAKQRGAGLVYVTSDLMPNPYDTLTPYWATLSAEAARAT